ncbi:MAG: hypothetical protein KTR31_33110 [Myxococcales bacterium]|nr:hypothetical protein [Myxococcales bacterium]
MIAPLIAWILACGTSTETHSHEGHDHAHEEGQGNDAEQAPSGPVEGAMGAYTVRLEPSAEALRLVVVDAEGTAVKAEGNAQVLLTGLGEAPQRVLLSADGEAWTGAAKAAGAAGYVAVMRVPVAGNQESARLTWGTVPEQVAAPPAAEHDHGEAGHGHDHGEGGDHTH